MRRKPGDWIPASQDAPSPPPPAPLADLPKPTRGPAPGGNGDLSRAQRERLIGANLAIRTRPEQVRQLVGDGSVLDLADVWAAYITEGKKPA